MGQSRHKSLNRLLDQSTLFCEAGISMCMWYSSCSCQYSPHLPVSLTLRYLYWLSSGQVRRCPLNVEVNCREKEEPIPTELSTVNDFALNTSSLETVLYQVNGSHLSVSSPDPGDMERVSALLQDIVTCALHIGCLCLHVYMYVHTCVQL